MKMHIALALIATVFIVSGCAGKSWDAAYSGHHGSYQEMLDD